MLTYGSGPFVSYVGFVQKAPTTSRFWTDGQDGSYQFFAARLNLSRKYFRSGMLLKMKLCGFEKLNDPVSVALRENFGHHFWPSRFLPIFACCGGPGSAAPRGGGPRGTQKLIKFCFLLARTFHENMLEAKTSQNLAKTSRKPPGNLPETSRKPREHLGNPVVPMLLRYLTFQPDKLTTGPLSSSWFGKCQTGAEYTGADICT